jgi:acyl-CoA synthetase (AMP-forming)/AMP-acid ligase II
MPNWTSGSTRSRVTEPGARIATLLLNDLDTVALYFAIARSGRVNVPINNRLNTAEAAFIVDDCDVATLIVERELVDVSLDPLGSLDRIDRQSSSTDPGAPR